MTWFNQPAPPPWYVEASRLMGLRETPGPQSNSIILGWAKALGGWVAKFYVSDKTPWCALLQAHCIQATLPGEKLPANPLGARDWLNFGQPLKTPALGALLIFARPGGAHIGQYLAETTDAYLVRGGNQSDKVGDAWIAKSRCVGIRWPSTYPLPTTGPVQMAGKTPGKVSQNEA